MIDVNVEVFEKDNENFLVFTAQGARIECAWTDLDMINEMFLHFHTLIEQAQILVDREKEVIDFVQQLDDL